MKKLTHKEESRLTRFSGAMVKLVGYRGAVLLFLAILDFLYGYSLIADPSVPLLHINLVIPLHVWFYVWIGIGVFLLTGVLTKYDRIHFALAVFLKSAWASAWLYVFIFQHFPRAWISVIIWATFAILIIIISFWPEPIRKEDIVKYRQNNG